MWTCPRCGRAFVTKGMWHSCVVGSEAEHLAGASADVVATYEAIRAAALRLGAKVEPVKTYIEFTGRTRFANVTVRRKWLLLRIGAVRPLEHPTRDKVEGPYGEWVISRFRLVRPDDFDATLRGYLGAAWGMFGQT